MAKHGGVILFVAFDFSIGVFSNIIIITNPYIIDILQVRMLISTYFLLLTSLKIKNNKTCNLQLFY